MCDGEFWKPMTDTLEKRYHQLEQVALWMLDTMTDFSAPAYAKEAREQLEALGVDIDG